MFLSLCGAPLGPSGNRRLLIEVMRLIIKRDIRSIECRHRELAQNRVNRSKKTKALSRQIDSVPVNPVCVDLGEERAAPSLRAAPETRDVRNETRSQI
jgi:hypothetical protein